MLGRIEIREQPTNTIFYRNVCVGEMPLPALYTYNFKSGQTLTEDRTIRYRDMIKNTIVAEAVFSYEANHQATAVKRYLKKMLMAEKGTFEASFDFTHVDSASEAFIGAVRELIEDGKERLINRSALTLYLRVTGLEVAYSIYSLTKTQQQMLENAYTEIEALGHRDVRSVPLQVTDDLSPGVMGMYKKGKMYLSSKVFLSGMRSVTGTLLEEYYHHKYKYEDETREFQNFLMDKLAECGKRLLEDKS
jgi:hypothetical protein